MLVFSAMHNSLPELGILPGLLIYGLYEMFRGLLGDKLVCLLISGYAIIKESMCLVSVLSLFLL